MSSSDTQIMDNGPSVYHPDPEINAEIAAEVLKAERYNLAHGGDPSRWQCPCGAQHGRGHFQTIGAHRCLRCGYVGTGGIMMDEHGNV